MLHERYTATPTTVSDNCAIEFANSLFSEHVHGEAQVDRLQHPEWRRWFAARCGYPDGGEPTPAEMAQLRRLRPALRRLLESNADPAREDLDELNLALRAAPPPVLVRERSGVELRRAPAASAWRGILAAVALAGAELLSGGDLKRVRVCANPACSYLFYDDSRNGSRRWCDAAICGNLVRVRRSRSRA
jgi:predicted RNA-binding Zn ribbon-like protein